MATSTEVMERVEEVTSNESEDTNIPTEKSPVTSVKPNIISDKSITSSGKRMATATEVVEGVISEKSPVISSDKSTTSSHNRPAFSRSPHRKRPRLDVLPTGDEVDKSIAFFLSLVKKHPEFKVDNVSWSKRCAELVLAHYKKETGLDYELTCEKSMSPFPFSPGYKGTHLNFFARLKGVEPDSEELFYAEIDLRDDKVYNCCILTPNQLGEPFVAELIKHPQDYVCKGCADGNHGAGGWEEVEEDSAECHGYFPYYNC